MRLRLWICILVAGFLLYHAIEQFYLGTAGLAGWFSLFWFAFCLLVIGGNLSLLLTNRKRVLRNPTEWRTKEESTVSQRGRARL
ncbi:hypothetical protein JCM19037_1192 [Geomicrobium sp. JCM 19037]|uniref:hypothetical protein n=1 Tax=Geomicrobium sp. JCM 19037 TaxID=1460634 RepID=UPI00045F290F|nr:hypothetical protein [Geomicrobium sp. JCM 19037]GAK02922.1 hypothetical protein JCM19037_1192 [Geomicrobium sp. JCM 19037]